MPAVRAASASEVTHASQELFAVPSSQPIDWIEHDRLRRENERLVRTLEEERDELDRLTREVDRLAHALQSLQGDHDRLALDRDESAETLRRERERAAEVEEALRTELEDLRADASRARAEAAEAQTEHRRAIHDLEEELTRLREESDRTRDSLTEVENEREALRLSLEKSRRETERPPTVDKPPSSPPGRRSVLPPGAGSYSFAGAAEERMDVVTVPERRSVRPPPR
ncbi:MAG: hypothetical protein HYV09_17995 [Deltaproteobacteria bacterium]|nr:hypothetical protein [Deltaproteobacteria bacterium]